MSDCVRDPRAFAVTIIKRIGIPWWYTDYDDLISEGYIGYLAAQKSFTPGKSSFSHWAYLKMRGYILNYLIKKSPKDDLCIDDVRDAASPIFSDGAFHEIDLQRAIARLPPRSREVLQLHYWEGLNFREIGQRYGLAKSSVGSIHIGAIKKLRIELENAKDV